MTVVGMVLALRSRVAWEEACTLARRRLPQMLGMEVGIGRCELDPVRQAVRLYGLSVFPSGGDEPLFSADYAEAHIETLAPFFGPTVFESLEVRRPRFNLDWSQPASSARKEAMCPLDVLKRVQVNHLSLKGAEVRMRLPQGHRVELSGVEVTWHFHRGQAELAVEARQGGWSLGPDRGTLAVSQFSVESTLDPDDGTLEVNQAELALDEVTLSLSGKVEQLCDPRLFLDGQLFLPLRTVTQALGVSEDVKGHLWAGVSVSGRGALPTVSFDVVGTDLSLGPYQPGDFTARLSLSGAEVTLSELNLPSGVGALRASGALTLRGNYPLRLQVDTEDAELGPLLAKAGQPGAWVNLRATGRGTAQGHLFPSLSLLGEMDFRTDRFVLTNRPYDRPEGDGQVLLEFESGRATGNVHLLPDRVEFSSVQLTTRGGSHASMDGMFHYDPQKGLRVNGRAEELVLSDFGHLARLKWKGTGQSTFEIAGPSRAVRIDATVNLHDFEIWDFSLGNLQGKALFTENVLRFEHLVGQKGHTPYAGTAMLDFNGRELHASAEVEVPRGGKAEDLLDAIVGLHPSLELFQGTMDGDADGRLRIDSVGGRLEGAVDLALAQMRYDGRRLGDGALRIALKREVEGKGFLNGESLDLEEFRLTGPIGEVSVQGRWSFDGPLDFKLRGGRLALAEIVGPERAQKLGITGNLSLDGKVEGDSSLPIVNLSLTSPNITFADRSLGEMLLNGKVVGREMQIYGKPFRDGHAAVHLTLRNQVPYDANLSLKLPEIRPLLPAGAISQGVSGVLEGVVTATGMARQPAATSLVKAVFSRLLLSRGDFTAENEGAIALRYEDQWLELDSLTLRGPNTRLIASGGLDADGLDVKLEGAFDTRLLESFVPALERTGGQLALNATAAGAWEAPSLVGSLKIRDVRLEVKDRAVAVRGLTGDVEFSERNVVVQDLHGTLNDGRVSAHGNVELEQFTPTNVSLSAQLEAVAFRPAEDLPLTASGQLVLAGKPDALSLQGNLDVLKLRYERPLELETLLRSAGAARESIATEAAKEKDWVHFDVGVRLGDVRVENNLARARLLGELRLVGSNAHPGLLGTVETGAGSQAFFRGNRFTVTQGLIELKDEKSIDPTFDLRAETQVREYLIRLHAFGRPADPKLALTSEPELPEADVISLLTLGIISKDRSNTGVSSASLATEALLNVSGLDREVQRFLPKNAVLRDLSFHLATAYNDVSGVVEPAAQLETKVLTEQLKLGVTRPVSGRGMRAQAEYRFSNSLSAQAQWDNDQNETSSLGNLGLDLKLRWEVE